MTFSIQEGSHETVLIFPVCRLWRENHPAPKEGAELYEVTPLGKEILRSIYTAGRWQTYEGGEWTTSRQYTATPLPRWCQYQGHTFMIRGEQEGVYQLATYQKLPLEGLEILEKGLYGIKVPVGKHPKKCILQRVTMHATFA